MFEPLATGVAEVANLDPDELSDRELSDALAEIHGLRSRLEAAEARLTGIWDARRCWAADEARTGAAWLGARCRMSSATAKRCIRYARALRSMPATAAAWADGEIGVDHVGLLVRARTPVTAECFERDEKLLVDLARDLRYGHFEIAVAYWRQHADPDGTEQRAGDQHGDRRMHLTQSGWGWWYGEFGLDPLNGAIVNETLRGIVDELFHEDWAEAKARVGDRVTVADLTRTTTQRWADAIVEMATRARATPAGGRRPAPLFTVLVGYETFAGRVCELANGTVVSPGALVPWLDEAHVERVVFDGPSRVIDVGVERRLFTGALRRAIQVRDRYCYHPMCDIPANRCDIDHEQRHADGGPTTQYNGRPACGFHNRLRERKRRRRPPPSTDQDDGDPE